jgi:O-antigen ligase
MLFLLSVLWVAVRALHERTPLDGAYAAGFAFGVASIVASAVGFDPLGGVIGGIIFCGIALAGNRVRDLAQHGAWAAFVTAWLLMGIVMCALALGAMIVRRPALLFAFAHGRAIGIFENPNELALFALAVCAVGLAAAFAGPQLYARRPLALAASILGVLTLVATGSRSGEASFAIGAIALAAMSSRRRGAMAAVAAAAVLVVALAVAVDRRHNPAENQSRLAAWQTGVRTIALFPLTGVGLGSFNRVYPALRAPDAPASDDPVAFDPHNFYITVAAETGVAGLGAFAWTIVVFIREARAGLETTTPEGRRFMLATLAGLLAIGIHLLFNAFALAIALWAVLAAFTLGLTRTVSVPSE